MKKVLFTLGIALALVSCSKGPESSAKNFAENMAKGDFTEAKKYATSQTGALLDMVQTMGGDKLSDLAKENKDYKFVMVKDSIVGDSVAWVTYTTKEGNEDVMNLVKENGEWKVSMGK